MVMDLYTATLGLLHLGFLFYHHVANVVGANKGIAKCLSEFNLRMLGYFLDWQRSKRRAIALMLRQNDPRFEENIKLFLGEILELDNASEHLDLHKMMHSDFEGWRLLAKKTVRRFTWRPRTLKASRERFLEVLEKARLNALLHKARIQLSSFAHFTLKYIYHIGGLTDHAK